MPNPKIQLSTILDTSRPSLVLREVRGIFGKSWGAWDFRPVARAFKLVKNLYQGRYPGYQACSTDYHDYHHILDVFVATARLLDGAKIQERPFGPEQGADLLIAALLHDVGYILEKGDTEGTGAKYTATHVDRSAVFVLKQAKAFRLSQERAQAIGRLILGTDMGKPWKGLRFQDALEEEGAAILAAADLLGQMGDRTYLEKLLFLYYEFREAGFGGYDSSFAILEKTLGFYDTVKLRLDSTLASTVSLAASHFSLRYGCPRDLYREAIDHQMAYLAGIVADDTSNFRHKLKRMDLTAIEAERASHRGATA